MVSFGRPATAGFPAADNDLELLVDLSISDLLALGGGAGHRLRAPSGGGAVLDARDTPTAGHPLK
jgi:hypothetical protein